MQNRKMRASRGALAAVAAALMVPGLVGAGATSADPTAGRECRMFETKPGYECRFGEWRVDNSPPRVGKACETFDKAPGLTCRGGTWRTDTTPEVGEPCKASSSDRGRGLECRAGKWRRA
ncbi:MULTISPECIES: hypothetical protein [Tsukamurella]|uniref:Uncharacterized protein n=2 Tax=Tsukamurella TaxID=2060 RepID=A0A5C5S5J9_9ACTN|nr:MULTISPECIES: hypothetical protein [Tsukamurella]NMD56837.1 hypothetical protein [Tsukamurella columbiensis]TWS29745.1 hypothetical protein FK530_04185 [Tsukamurella conjunctivitidis]